MTLQEEIANEVFQLQQQKEKLLAEITQLEEKLSVTHSAMINGKITLPCQTEIGIQPEWHLKTNPNWSIGRIKIIAILDMNEQNSQGQWVRPNWSSSLDTGRMTIGLDMNQHVIELYDKRMFNRMTFD